MYRWKTHISGLYKKDNKRLNFSLIDFHEAPAALQGVGEGLKNCPLVESISISTSLVYQDKELEDLGKYIAQCKNCKIISLTMQYYFQQKYETIPLLKKFISQISKLKYLKHLTLNIKTYNIIKESFTNFLKQLCELRQLKGLRSISLQFQFNNSININAEYKNMIQIFDELAALEKLQSVNVDFGRFDTYKKYQSPQLYSLCDVIRRKFIKQKQIVHLNIGYEGYDPYEGTTYE